MAVPNGSASYLVNTTGGAFSATTEGGTILGNSTTGTVITKSFPLKDAADDIKKAYGPVERAYPGYGSYPTNTGGLYGTQKALSGGTFAFQAAGSYVIMTQTTTLSGVAKTNLLIPGANSSNQGNAILQFKHDFGARLLAKWRGNSFSWTGNLDNGNSIKSRLNWLNSAGTAPEAPSTATDLDMFDPVAGSTASQSDSAANPTRAIPGELVMKVDFVTTSVASGGDFFDYKPITGM